MKQELRMNFTNMQKYRELLLLPQFQGLRTVNMRTVYYDTPERAFMRHGVTCRICREDGRLIATIKAPDRMQDGIFLRSEWTAEQPDEKPEPGRLLHGLLERGDLSEELHRLAEQMEGKAFEPIGRVDFIRQRSVLERFGARIEISIDNGCLSANGRIEEIWEIEAALLSGDGQVLQQLRSLLERRYAMKPGSASKHDRCLALMDAQKEALLDE